MLGIVRKRSSGMPAIRAVVEGLYGYACTSTLFFLWMLRIAMEMEVIWKEGKMLMCAGWNRDRRLGRRIRSITIS